MKHSSRDLKEIHTIYALLYVMLKRARSEKIMRNVESILGRRYIHTYMYIYRRFAAFRDKNRYHREGSIAPRASLENFSREIIITVRKQRVPRPRNCGHALIHFRLSDMFTGVLHNVRQLWRCRSVLMRCLRLGGDLFFSKVIFPI